MTRAVPSLIRLSARSKVMPLRGSDRARVPTAVASVGATAAPSTQDGPHGTRGSVPSLRPSTREDDQRGAHQKDAAQVPADLAQGGRQAPPVEQRRQEKQQDSLRQQVHPPKRWEEPDQRADDQQQDRWCDTQMRPEDVAAKDRHAKDDDEVETEQGIFSVDEW